MRSPTAKKCDQKHTRTYKRAMHNHLVHQRLPTRETTRQQTASMHHARAAKLPIVSTAPCSLFVLFGEKELDFEIATSKQQRHQQQQPPVKYTIAVTKTLAATGRHMPKVAISGVFISPTHKRTEGRAPVWGSEFTSKDAALQGGSSRNRC
jgi:hypothetical protein